MPIACRVFGTLHTKLAKSQVSLSWRVVDGTLLRDDLGIIDKLTCFQTGMPFAVRH